MHAAGILNEKKNTETLNLFLCISFKLKITITFRMGIKIIKPFKHFFSILKVFNNKLFSVLILRC